MKKSTLLIVSLFIIFVVSCNQNNSNKYDFSKIQSPSELQTLLKQIENENEEVKLDTIINYNDITVKGMHYDGVPIKNAVITRDEITLKTDTLNYSGKRLLEAVEAKKGLTLLEDSYWDDIKFNWKSETEDVDFKLILKNGSHLADLKDKDYAELTISYNPIYKSPLANIHKEVKVYNEQPKYIFKIGRTYGKAFTIIVDDIVITEDNDDDTAFDIQNYITSETTSVKVIVKPVKSANSNSKVFINEETIAVGIVDEFSGEVFFETTKKAFKGKSSVEIEFGFNSKLPIYPKAWSNGVDLRNDKNLKEKIKTLYSNLGNAFIEKDEQTINDMLYQMNFEKQQLSYDTNFETARENWEFYKQIQDNSYKYTVADKFEIEYNANGKLIYLYAKDKPAMLTFTGKRFSKRMNFFLYQPKGADGLKIIR